MKVGSLFSGYDGLGLALAQSYDVETAWFSDIEPAAGKVLAHHWPDVPNLGDITEVEWSQVEPVDVLTGGFPCTDVSCAGRRAGLAPTTRSGLWSHMSYAVAELRPPLVLIENVRGLCSAEAIRDVEPCPWCVGDRGDVNLRALGAVLADLADIGFDARWCGLRAADVGAPHGRYRVFIAATDTDGRASGQQSVTEPRRRGKASAGLDHAAVADTQGDGWNARRSESAGLVGRPDVAERSASPWGQYADAIHRWERILGRIAPAPTVTGARGGQTLNPVFVEWMQGLPLGHVTAVDGLSRNDMLKLLGNGVVPQQAAAAFDYLQLNETERAA